MIDRFLHGAQGRPEIHGMIFGILCRFLEWHLEIDHQRSVKTGSYGRGLKKRVHPEIWSALEQCYPGEYLEENWKAMFRRIEQFRKAAEEVGQALGYTYPIEMDLRAVACFQKVRALVRGAHSLSF